MKMETDYIQVPKMILIDNNSNPRNNKLLSTNESLQNAEYLYNEYHYFQSFISDPLKNFVANQFLIKNFDGIPFCFEDYEKVRLNNRIFDANGNEGELITLKWNPIEETASGTFKIRQIYTNNLKETKIVLDGK